MQVAALTTALKFTDESNEWELLRDRDGYWELEGVLVTVPLLEAVLKVLKTQEQPQSATVKG